MLNAVRPFIVFYQTASFSTPRRKHGLPRSVWRSLVHGWRAARRYRRLASMNDDQLKRLGLDRGSIGRLAFFGELPSDRE